jgi:putative salt-induced outer membrane protein YdiY
MGARHARLLTIAALVSIGLCGLSSGARADTVELKNGDKVTGKIASVSKRQLIVETELAGRATIAWSAVSTVTTTTGIRATLGNGLAVEGTALVSDGRVSIRLANGTTLPLDLDTLRTFALASEMDARTWHAALIAGLDLSRGNSETLTMATNGVATLLGPRDRFGLFGLGLFSSVGSGATETTTARTARGGVRYDHDLIGVLYGFGFAEAENDPLQLLDLRTVGGGGLGAHVYKTDMTQFNVFAGVSYANDSYSQVITTTTTPPPTTPTTPTTPGQGGTPPGQGGTAPGQGIKPTRSGTPPAVVNTTLSRSVAEALAGQDFFHQLTDNLSLFEALTFFTAVNNRSDNRLAFDVSLSAQLNGWLQWNLSVADRYLNIPPSGGAVQNDLYVSTGLGITFGRGANGAYRGAAGPPVRK